VQPRWGLSEDVGRAVAALARGDSVLDGSGSHGRRRADDPAALSFAQQIFWSGPPPRGIERRIGAQRTLSSTSAFDGSRSLTMDPFDESVLPQPQTACDLDCLDRL